MNLINGSILLTVLFLTFVSVLSPAIGMTLYGPNWNGVYWEQNSTQGTDSLAAIIDSASPTLTKTFKIIFIISGNHYTKVVIVIPKR